MWKKEMEPDELKKLCENEIRNAKKIIMSSKTIIAIESKRQSIYEYVLKDLVDISSMFYFQYSTTEITDAFIANKEKYLRKLSAIKNRGCDTKRKKINKNDTIKMKDKELIKKINVTALRVLCKKYDDADGGLPNCQGEGMELFRFFQRLIYAHKKK